MINPRDTLSAALADRYTVERELGSGGMATVYLANDLRHDRLVALKVLKPEVAVVLGADRFLREIKTTAQLSHPHILPLFDSGTADDLLYYVMPYVEGDTLEERIAREGKLSEEEALQIATEVLGALDYAHGQGVIHRDIKPSNIMVSATGHALLADFGIARAISAAGADSMTRPGAVVGTPAYMPPEQARGEHVSPATDVYATGLVLYESLTGNRFPEPSLYHAADWSAVPTRCRDALQRALRPEPAARWPDAAAFRAALRKGGGVWQRVWTIAAATATLVALVVILFSLGRTSAPPATGDTRLVVFPFTVRGGGGLDYLGDGMVDLLSAKLNGAGSWRTADPRAVLSLVRREANNTSVDPEAGRRMARRMDAGLFVLGNVIALGRQVRLDATLYRTEPSPTEAVAQASAEGEGDDVLELLDTMAGELLSRAGEGADARLTRIARMTSQSLPALKSYLRGVRALRAGEFADAAEAFEEAIAADSGFALAWYQLSVTADWLLRADLALEAADQAVRYAARLPERDRQLLEALRTIRMGDAETSEQQLRAILGRHPDDIEAWSQLAELQFHFGPPRRRPVAESRDAWLRLLELEPEWTAAYIHLARIAAGERDLEALDSLSSRALQLAPEGDRGLEMRTLRLMLQDDAAARARVRGGLRDAPDDVLGEVNWSTGTFVRDRDIRMLVLDAATGARSRDLRMAAFGYRASTEATYGRLEAARAAVDSVTALDSARGVMHGAYLALEPALRGETARLFAYRDQLAREAWPAPPPSGNQAVWFWAHDRVRVYIRWYLLGIAHALADEEAAALAFADSLDGAEPPTVSGSVVPDFAETVRATVAWRAGRIEDALAAFDRVRGHIWHQLAASSGFYSHGFTRYLHALVLEAAGRAREAVSWYATLTETSPEDRVFDAPAQLRLARITEALGDSVSARRHYRAFLALWDQADPELQSLVADAREGLRALDASDER